MLGNKETEEIGKAALAVSAENNAIEQDGIQESDSAESGYCLQLSLVLRTIFPRLFGPRPAETFKHREGYTIIPEDSASVTLGNE